MAPLASLHDNVGSADTLVAPSSGDASAGAATGARGIIVVVKLQISEYGLVPAPFKAFIRQ
jgi:hypothetical protein